MTPSMTEAHFWAAKLAPKPTAKAALVIKMMEAGGWKDSSNVKATELETKPRRDRVVIRYNEEHERPAE